MSDERTPVEGDADFDATAPDYRGSDTPSDERTAEIQRFAKGLTVYASHLGNCPYESWNKPLTKCKCGLFALLKQAEAVLKVKPTQTECPHCPHWMELHNDDGSCGCGASHPTIGEPQ
jgi:hypothetical protein